MKFFIKLLFLSLTISIVFSQKAIEWKFGIATIDKKPLYIDPKKLDQSFMVISEKYIKKYQDEKKEKIPAGKLIWKDNGIMTLDTLIDEPYSQISKTRTIYQYKIQNNQMFLSKDGIEWDQLFIEIVDDKPKFSKTRIDPPVYMIIYLKCKWFEGEYELIGTTG